jgi:molecular chaperone DnaK
VGKTIGIDLGTTNSCLAVLEGGVARVIPTAQGQRTLPSVVAFERDGTQYVGALAQRQAAMNPRGTVFGVKRLVGRKFADPVIQAWKEAVPYEIVPAKNGDAWIEIDGRQCSPQEILAIVLTELRKNAEAFLGERIEGAVITVPAYFNDSQRQAIRDASVIADIDLKSMLNEPTAAALGYGVDTGRSGTVAVCDLGGGTFDVTVLRIAQGVFKVLSTCGDTFLGGNDFDRCVADHLAAEFQKKAGKPFPRDPVARQRLLDAAESSKRILSSTDRTTVSLPFVAAGSHGPLHLSEELRGSELEQLTAALCARLEQPCRKALADAGLAASDVEQVLLVGGMTRMPAVQRTIERVFGRTPSRNVNPDEIVAVGAATQSGVLAGEIEDVLLLDVTPHSLGVRVIGERMSVLIERNTTIPASARKIFATTRDGQESVDIEVYQGEGALVQENTLLGEFSLVGLPSKRAAEVQIEVTFTIDADGMLDVSAMNMLNRKSASIEIRPHAGLGGGEIHRLADKARIGRPGRLQPAGGPGA